MATLIDHTAYSNIIDAILFHAAPDALLAFCSTAKQYRRRLAVSLYHCSLTRKGNKNHRLTSKHDRSLTPAMPAAMPFVPALVVVLDLDDDNCRSHHDNLHAVDDDTNSAFTSLITLRRIAAGFFEYGSCTCLRPHYPYLPPAATVVDFVNPDPSHFRWHPSLSVAFGPKTERYVLHIVWAEVEPPYTARFSLAMENLDMGPLEIVIVMSPVPGHHCFDSAIEFLKDMIYLVSLNWGEHGLSGISLTLVGSEALDWSPIPRDFDVDTVLDEVCEECDDVPLMPTFSRLVWDRILSFQHHWRHEYELGLLKQAKYMTVEEWHASLGDDPGMLRLGW